METSKPTLEQWQQANPQAYRAECNGCPVIHAQYGRDDIPGLFHLSDYGVSSVGSGPTYWMITRSAPVASE